MSPHHSRLRLCAGAPLSAPPAFRRARRAPSGLLPALVAAWLLLAAAAAAAQDAQAQYRELTKQIDQYVVEGVKRGAARDFDGAIALHRKAFELAEKNFGPDDLMTGWTLDYLGASYVDKGDYKEAESLLTRAVKILDKLVKEAEREAQQEGADPVFAENAKYMAGLHAKAVHDLALVYDWLGDPGRAEPLYGHALAVREKVRDPDHFEVAESLNALAVLYLGKADYAPAAQMFRRALDILRKRYGPDHPRVTIVMANLAAAYEGLNDAAKAEELLKQAIATAEKWPEPNNLNTATYLNNLGHLYRAKRPAEARPLLERALAIREKILGPEDPVVAVTVNNLAMLDWQEGRLKEAEERFLRAIDIPRRAYGAAHPNVAHSLSNLALLYLARGETKRAVSLLSEGSRHSERNLLSNLLTGTEKQKRVYMQSIVEGTSALVSLHLGKAPADEQAARLALNTILWRKGRVLDVMSGQLAAVVSQSDAEAQAALRKLVDARGELSRLVIKGSDEEGAERRARMEALQSQIQALDKLIGERAAASGAGFGSVDVESVRALIPAGAALVEVIEYRPAQLGAAATPEWGPPRYAAYVLKPEAAPASVDLGDAAKIDADVKLLRDALRNPRSTDVRARARAVDEQVMRPVRKLLGDARQVLISPDGALNLLPYAALVDEQNRHLVENYTFTYLTSGRDLLRLKDRPAPRQAPVVIANPLFDKAGGDAPPAGAEAGGRGTGERAATFGARFIPLAATAEEAREVSAVLRGARTFTGAQATEAAVKQVKAPSILHIATHGFFMNAAAGARGDAPAALQGSRALLAENPLLRSGLALAGANVLDGDGGEDGVLTALEAAGLDLRGTELIVLSACETGVGEVQSGEGVYGLRRALVLAGAESQLMSLWKVNDDATRELMVGFYKKLQAGAGRSEALRQVQLKLLGDEEYGHPYFWAGFIMSGKWGPLVRAVEAEGSRR